MLLPNLEFFGLAMPAMQALQQAGEPQKRQETSLKKFAIPMALCGLALNAVAQSSVTLYGVLDTTVQRASQGSASITRVYGTGGNQYSRLGVRGTEDLGGGQHRQRHGGHGWRAGVQSSRFAQPDLARLG